MKPVYLLDTNVISEMTKASPNSSTIEKLEKKLCTMEDVISEKQSLIEDLEAYKKSLIYEVVTGKRKVVA